MARERGQANVHATAAMKGSCVMNVPSCTMKSRVKTLNQSALVSELIHLVTNSSKRACCVS